MIAVAFPEAGFVVLDQFDAADPFGGFPGVEMGDDEAGWGAVFGGEGLAVVVGGDEGIGGEEGVDGEVGGPAEVVGVNEGEEGVGGGTAGEVEEGAGGDTLPEVAEAGPAGDAVEVGKDLNLGELGEVVPSERDLVGDKSIDFETPAREVDARGAGGIEDGPLSGPALPWGDPVGAAGVRADDGARGLGVRRGWEFVLVFVQVVVKHGVSGLAAVGRRKRAERVDRLGEQPGGDQAGDGEGAAGTLIGGVEADQGKAAITRLDQMKGFTGGTVVGTGDPGDGPGPIRARGHMPDGTRRRGRESEHEGEGQDAKGPAMMAKQAHKYESGHGK